ncbi:MAG: DNRLRE domain-containing protein, partial [Coriobacteriia bacterium]
MRLVRGIFGRAVSLAISFTLVLSTVQVAPAYAAPPEQPPARRELVDKRTASSRTWDNRDGTYTYESYVEPIHFKNAETGFFEEIDSSLVETVTPEGKGYKNRRNGFAVFLPETIAEQAVSISDDLGSVRLRPKGRLGEPPVHEAYEETSVPTPMTGNSRRYERAFGGADIVYDSVARGLKETIVLRSATGKNTFSFDLDCPGFTPSLEASGSITFRSLATGEVRFEMVPPYMQDSAEERAYSNAVHYELKSLGVNWRLDVVADRQWLADPARVYPVRIDPTTYWTIEHPGADTYVTDAYPTTNYGLGTSALVGRYDAGASGKCRMYFKPVMDGLPTEISVLSARLEAYCYDRVVAGTSSIQCSRVLAPWDEYAITWNNQPAVSLLTSDDVAEGEWGGWNVTSVVQGYILGTVYNYGFQLKSSAETVNNTLCRFYTWDHPTGAFPRLIVNYTSEPDVEILAPSAQVPVRSDATTIHAHVRYGDASGKKLSALQAQVATSPASPVISDTGSVQTTAPVVALPVPAAGWTQASRYWIRARAWGAGDEGLEAYSAPSDWTEWQPFDRKALTASNDGLGLLPWKATEPIGAGLSVDLVTGNVIGSRADVSFPALGGALTYGATYCSTRTADAGLGKGWQLAAPKLSAGAQKAPNPSFESADSNNNPVGWIWSWDLVTAVASSWQPAPDGTKYLMIGQNPANGFFSASVSSNAGGTSGTRVYPGERLSASVKVLTYNLTADTSQSEYGALMKLHFYDATGNLVNTLTSEGYTCYDTASSRTWRTIALEGEVPEGAYYVKLNLESKNLKGYAYFDQVVLDDKELVFTDGDGTSRTVQQSGDGEYGLDPLEPSVAFSHVNVARGAEGKTSAGAVVTEATDGVINNIHSLANYDAVTWNASGSAYLEYTLEHAQVIEGADIYFYEREDITPRTYTYRVLTSSDGTTFSQAYPALPSTETTAMGWARVSFTPRRVKAIRIVALGNTESTGFEVAELECRQTRLGDAVVCFDGNGRLEATGDLSGNPVAYEYDASGHIDLVKDLSVTTAVKAIDPVWSSGVLSRVDYKGVDSAGVASTETSIVSFASVGSEYRINRRLNGADVPVATYTYDASGRIIGAKDATGIGYRIEYSATTGKAYKVYRSGLPTETATTYFYYTGSASIYHGGNGINAATRYVSYSSTLGNQPVSVRVDSTDNPDLVTSLAYDEYGQLWKTTDPLGRVTRTERDGRGLPIVMARDSAQGALLEQTVTYYDDGHVIESRDQKNNASTVTYDDAWRVLNAQQVVTDVAGEGESADARTYDGWGNLITSSAPGSTTYNLLRNGTFEIDPLITGNGWDGPRGLDPSWAGAVQDYLGGHVLGLGSYSGASFITSDEIPVLHDKTYALSAWMQNWGQVIVVEYDKDHVFAGTYTVLQSVSPGSGTLEELKARRVSANYRVREGVAYVRIRPYTLAEGGFSVDNVRFELANTASADSLVENESMEQVSGGLPRAWMRRSTTYTTAIHEADTDEREAGATSAHIGHTTTSADGYFCSDVLTVGVGERYTVSASLKTKDSVGGAKVRVRYLDAQGVEIATAGQDVTNGLVKGTKDWCRYVTQVTVPAGAAKMRIYFDHAAGGGDAWVDAVVITPASGISQTGFDATTHAYSVVATDVTGVVASTVFDSRGRATDVSIKPAGGVTTALTERDYDSLDRMTRVETAPDSGLGITASFTYDAAGRLATLSGPASTTTTVTYDAAGRVTGVISPSDIRTKTLYDGLGRTSAVLAPAQGQEPTRTISSVVYDGLSRPKTTTTFAENGAVFSTRTLTYDLGSRVTAESLTGAVQASASTVYDDLDRVTSRTESGPAGGASFAYTYDPASLPLTSRLTAFGESATTTMTYARTNELAKITSEGRDWHVAYAGAGGLSSIWSTLSIHTRSFDIYGRLEAVRLGFKYPDQAYHTDLAESVLAYDSRGRIASHDLLASPTRALASAETFGYDTADRLTSWNRTGLGAGSATYGFDSSGNLTTATVSGVTSVFTSDAENRLTRSVAGSIVTTFTNDLYGRRTARITPSGTTTYT